MLRLGAGGHADTLGRVTPVCLLVVASRVVAGEPLIVGANRDEVLERPSTAVTVLDEGPPRDSRAAGTSCRAGTWLAVNEHGVCAGLTNQPLGDAKDPSKRSRGELPLALARHATAAAAVDALLSAHRPADYNGSWLLVGDRTSLFFVDFTGSGDGHGGRPAARDPRAGEPGARRALAQGRPGAGRARRHGARATRWRPPSAAS